MQYLSEHIICRNYENTDTQSIQYKEAFQGERIESEFIENKIIFVLKGLVFVNCGKYSNYVFAEQMIVIPAGTPYMVEVMDDMQYIICKVSNNLHLCDEFSMEKLFQEEDTNNRNCRALSFCHPMRLYADTLRYYLKDGIRCRWFYEIKMRELFFILRNYYKKEDLCCFFSPLLSDDVHFSDFIIKNHRKVRNVKEFAELANYSISGFEKRFKKVFHVSAYRWMKEQKGKEILHELRTSSKTFKEIGWEYGFTSPAQFNDFCKSNFDMTPGQIRDSVTK